MDKSDHVASLADKIVNLFCNLSNGKLDNYRFVIKYKIIIFMIETFLVKCFSRWCVLNYVVSFQKKV